MSPWAFLGFAIALEVLGTFLLKLSDGFEKPLWGVLSIACYSACFWALAPAMKALPVGVVYAIWSGVGIVAASLIGLFAFDERLGALQFLFIAMIMIGAVGLQLTASGTHG
ncbi:MAG: multidrug efflux SMR transporter [Erythrobacter sp.]|nr:multidrug efflux SMR transporter [Erythrobacter sp.]